jgi:FkbM family methyltransferase
MINYFRDSIRRKIARRVTREYDFTVKSLNLDKDGIVEFADWNNPLAPEIIIDQETVDFYRKFISPGDMIIDIGTNIGDTTVPMAVAAGAGGLTLGFDPNPVVFKILEVNASLNKDKTNIHPYRYAITAEDEEFYFVSSEASFGNGAISKTKESRHGRFVYPEMVRGINLPEFLAKNYGSWLPKLSFIKIDAEGYDKEIIKSISSLIMEHRPVLVAESFGESSDQDKYDLFDTIRRHGYNLWYFSDFKVNAEISELKERDDILKWKNTINLYSIPNSL